MPRQNTCKHEIKRIMITEYIEFVCRFFKTKQLNMKSKYIT